GGSPSATTSRRSSARRSRNGWELLRLHERPQLLELLAAELVDLAAVDPRQELADERGEVERVERLRHVVDAADVEAAGAVAELRPRGEEDDRDLPGPLVLEQLLRDAPAVEPGHHHVEKDDVGTLGPRELEPRDAVGRLEHAHLLRFEVHPAEQADRRLVVDDENLRARGVHRRAIPRVPHSRTHFREFSDGTATGSSKEKRDPSPSRDATQMRPPIAVTRPRAMNRPSPVPPAPTRSSASAPR